MFESLAEVTARYFPDGFDADLFLLKNSFAEGTYETVDLSEFTARAANKTISNSSITFPAGEGEKIRSKITLNFNKDVDNVRLAFFAVPGGKLNLTLWGQNQTFTNFSRKNLRLKAVMGGNLGNSLTIGEGVSIVSGNINLRNCDMSVGASGLWSDEVIVQGGDQHNIISLSTMKISNDQRCFVKLGRHVWLGRRSLVMKNVEIGNGSIVGAGAVVSRSVPTATAVVGSNNKLVKQGNITWGDSSEHMKEVHRISLALGSNDRT